jgi:sulfur carrier protein
MRVTVNGEVRLVDSGTTVAAVVTSLGGGHGGVAVAVNDAVVPRAAWETTELDDGDRVEVLTAVQGG